eukprot:660923-Amphidinium_carterae.1
MGDLDGQLGLELGIDGVIRPHDLEVRPPPALVLPPQDLTPCPEIISNLPWEFQDTLDDLQFSTSSSLLVVLPSSPRSDLGGVIGYAVDMEGVLHTFDLEQTDADQTSFWNPGTHWSQLQDSGLATFLSESYDHAGGCLYTSALGFLELAYWRPALTTSSVLWQSLSQCLESRATFLPELRSHSGGTTTIRVDNGSFSFIESIHPQQSLADWKATHHMEKNDLYWQGAKLDPLICLEQRAHDYLVVTLHPRMWHEGNQPLIRTFGACRTSKMWSLAEISFWHPQRQPLTPICMVRRSENSSWSEDPLALDQRQWLADLLDRLCAVSRMLHQWRLSQHTKKRPRSLLSDWSHESSVIVDYPSPHGVADSKATTVDSALPLLPLAHIGGVSDSTIRGRLASKAAAAGMKNPGELLGLLWPGHSSALRSATGNAAVIKSILVSLAKKEGIVVEVDDPLSMHDPWAGHRAHQQQHGAPASSSKPSQANVDKFEGLQLHSTLQLNTGNELHATDLASLDSNSGGYLFIHATCLPDALLVMRSCNYPVVLITQKGAHSAIQEKTLDAQVVTSTSDTNAKKVLQVTLVLHNIETLEVVQQAAILQIPSPVKHDIVIELYEEHCQAITFSSWLKRGDLRLVLATEAMHFMPAPVSNFRVSGEAPARIIRRQGAIPVEHVLFTLAQSGTEGANVKLCRTHLEEELDISTVWAQTTDRDELMTQLRQLPPVGQSHLPHIGVVRTRNGRFLVRCLADQVAAVRNAIAKEDHRFKNMPDLVVTRKWRVSNVPSSLSSTLLSDALRLCHQWDQVPIGNPFCKGKAATWAPVLGSAAPPPQAQLLVQDHICIVTEIGGKQPQPSATVNVTTPPPGLPVALPPKATMTAQVTEGLRQSEIILTSQMDAKLAAKVAEIVDSKMQQVSALEKQVSQLDENLQALHAHSTSSSSRME